MEIGAFIGKWLGVKGGAERANYGQFINDLCQALEMPTPGVAEAGTLSDYQFEGPVSSEAVFFSKHKKRIDLYKRDCFILEAKQTQLKPGETLPPEPEAEPLEAITNLFGEVVGHQTAKGKRPPRYDRLLADARVQAERYALALPKDHRTPPFLIVADIGRSFELYFDWAGNGRGYSFFPDQQNYRITLDALESNDEVGNTKLTARALLRGIWMEPASVDPRLKAADVTREIAKRLSRVAEGLETTQRQLNPGKADFEIALGIEETSLFLMRVLFCMFAEDVELLKKGSFTTFLEESRGKTDRWWQTGLDDLWTAMNQPDRHNRYWKLGDAEVPHFNGNLFSSARVYDLPMEFKGELYAAATHDWRSVEPAIFGTLLEQVLTTAQRAQLGAHYTPRPYVQRLVSATFGDLLSEEWAAVEEAVRGVLSVEAVHHETSVIASEARQSRVDGGTGLPRFARNDGEGADTSPLSLIRTFHTRLTAIRILDPACGTGNFLYVSMEELLRLEGKALALAESLGEVIAPAVHPNQFLGLELNPRAAVIAELVLWIGWLRHRLANHPASIGDPVLPTLTNINGGTHGGFDAVLRRTATGEPDSATPMVPDWPEADFIVGNPPFIGGKDIRAKLGGDYAETLWKANPRVPKSADFVMHWWDHAAFLLTRPGTRLKRFGFVTTNSITQTFSRRVIEGYLAKSPFPLTGEGGASAPGEGAGASAPKKTLAPKHGAESLAAQTRRDPSPDASRHPLPQGERGLSLILAIPDHPWTKATPDAAAVRIAMTVAQAGEHEGRLIEITRETALDTDQPVLEIAETRAAIHADLSGGADAGSVAPLKANQGAASAGVKLHGPGFIVTPAEALHLGLGKREGLEKHIRPYVNGRDLLQKPRGVMIIDLFGLDEKVARTRFPEVYQHLLSTVKESRAAQVKLSPTSDAKAYLETFWLHGKPRQDMRLALAGLDRFIVTPETSKHRVFQFLGADVLPDNANWVVASDEAWILGVLQSRLSLDWILKKGGTLEDRPKFTKTDCFDPFPFPDATPAQRAAIAELAEELDATRKAALAEVAGLTMTEIYNLREKLRSGVEMSHEEADRAKAARAGIVHRLHEQIDTAVATAYGWADDWKRGDLAPSEIVARLVALNAERAAEETSGNIRWLRPDYQIPRFGN